MIIIAVIAYIFWAVFGLFFWIPLLFRVIAGFCAGLVYNMVVNNPERIYASKISLELAISFYAKGFQSIYSAIYEKSKLSEKENKVEFHFLSFLGQVLWTLLFWGLTIFPFVKHDVYSYFQTMGYSATKCVEEADRDLSVHDTANAIRMITRAIKKDEFNANYYYKRGMLLYYTSKFKKAVDDLESAMNLDTIKFGKDPSLALNIGLAYSEFLNQKEKAIAYYSTCIKFAPKFAYAYLQRGICYNILNENDLALNDYNSAISLDPNLGIAYSNKAGILYDKGQKEQACTLYDQAINAGFMKAKEYKDTFCK